MPKAREFGDQVRRWNHRGVQPLVSIVMPCFNNEAYVAEAIDSALGQTYDNIEVIVIDDGSTDASLDIIRSYGDRITWRTGPNEGACAARNKGLASARGEFIKFLDADDILLPKCIAAQVEQSRGQPEYIVIFGDSTAVYDDGTPMPVQKRRSLGDGDFASLAWMFQTGPLTSTPLYPKALLEDAGGFRIGLAKGQEHDLNLRLTLRGARFLCRPTICYLQRSHGSPHRISNRVPPGEFRNRFDGPEPINDFLSEAGTIVSKSEFHQLKAVVARYCWQRGRAKLRHGDHATARAMFDLAKSICARDCLYGSLAYRALCRICGPRFAEHAGITLAAISRLWRRRSHHGRSEGNRRSQVKQT